MQRDPSLINGKVVESRAVAACKSFQLRDLACLGKALGVEFQRLGRGKDPRAAAGAFLGCIRVWGCVCAQKERFMTGCGGFNQRLPMGFALGNR